MCVCVCVCVYVCMRMCVCVCVCAYIGLYIDWTNNNNIFKITITSVMFSSAYPVSCKH